MYYQSLIFQTDTEPTLAEIFELLPYGIQTPATASNPDILTIRALRNNVGIDQIHKLVQWVALRPYGDHEKLAIIYQADTLTIEAQNGLLKALEEPSHDTIICLLTTTPGALLPTILSRCLVISAGDNQIDKSEQTAWALQFLRAEYIARSKMVEELLGKTEARRQHSDLILALMHMIVEQGRQQASASTDLAQLKTAYQALQANVTPKLTWETLGISIQLYKF